MNKFKRIMKMMGKGLLDFFIIWSFMLGVIVVLASVTALTGYAVVFTETFMLLTIWISIWMVSLSYTK